MVTWPLLKQKTGTTQLFLPEQSNELVRLAVYVESPTVAHVASGVTLPEVWPLAGTRVVLLRPGAGHNWGDVERIARSWPPHRIGWLDAGSEPVVRLDIGPGGAIPAYDLYARSPRDARSQVTFALSNAARFTLSTIDAVGEIAGAVDLLVLENKPVRLVKAAGQPSLRLDLAAATAGVLRFEIAADDDVLRKLTAEVRFFVRGERSGTKHAIDHLRYPFLAPAAAEPVKLAGAFDPMRRLEQIAFALPTGARIGSYLMTDEGERLSLTVSAARFASQPSPIQVDGASNLDDHRLYFTPLGKFMIEPPASRLGGKNPRPFRLLVGLAGTEFVEIPNFETDDTARSLSFELGDALFMDAPWRTNQLVTSDAFRAAVFATAPLSELARTAWLRFGAPNAKVFSQPQRAPLFAKHEKALSEHAEVVAETAAATLSYAPTQVAAGADLLVPVAPVGGIRTEPGRDPFVLAAQRIAPARLAAVLAAPTLTSLNVARAEATTPQGFCATLQNGQWQHVKLATGKLHAPPAGAGLFATTVDVEFSFELPTASQLRTELLQPELALAWSCWDVDPDPSNVVTELAAEQWKFDANLGGATSKYDPFGGITLFKFHSGTLRELIYDPKSYRSGLNKDPSQTRDRVLELLAPALEPARAATSADATPAAYWKPLRDMLDDPTWTGILTLNARIAKAPGELEGLIANMDASLRVKYLAIPLNRINGQLLQHDAAVSGLIDYTNDRPLTRNEYDLVVRNMRVLFVDNGVERFECKVDLKAEEMFFEAMDIENHPKKEIVFFGRYEAHGPNGGPTYTFETDKNQKFKFTPSPKERKSVFTEIVVERLKYVTESTTEHDATHNMVNARITLRGYIAFGKEPFPGLDFGDIFAFDRIEFDDLALELGTCVDKLATSGGKFHHIDFFAPRLTFNVNAERRLKSLFGELPLKLKGFLARLHRSPGEDILSNRGFFRLGQTGDVFPNFAMVFAFDLGSLGGLVGSLKGLAIDIAVGWRDFAPVFAIRLPEVSGGERAFGIEGVLRVLMKDLQFHRTEQDKFFLRLCKAQLELLGYRFPPDSLAISGLIIADTTRAKPAWVVTAEYKKPKQLAEMAKLDKTAKSDEVELAAPDPSAPFVAVGQSIQFATDKTSAKDVARDLQQLFTGFEFTDGEPPPKEAEKILDKTGEQLKYAPDHDWLFALRLPLKTFLGADPFLGEIDVIFSDPSLYGLYAEFFDLHVDLLYRRVADGVGMFYVDFPLPFGPITAGLATITLPTVGITVLTDGGFKLDLGFPANMDFARSFRLEMTPFGGAGGFYLARFGTAGSDLLASTDERKYATIWQAGFGLRVGYTASLAVGPFSASASISVYAMLEGALGFVLVADKVEPKAVDIAVRGRFGIMASLQCHLDLVVTALEFGIDLWVGIELVVRIINRELQPVDVAFEVGVRVRVRWVIARFKILGQEIEIAIALSFERTIRYSTQLGGSKSRAGLQAAARAYSFQLAENESWVKTIADPHDPNTFALAIYFTPEVAITATKAANVIALLAIECSPPIENNVPPPAGKTPFDHLLRRVIRWAARADTYAPDAPPAPELRYTRSDVRRWRDRLGPDHSTAAAGLSYATIRKFLEKHATLTIQDYPSWTEEEADRKALALFPVFSELVLTVDGEPHRFDRSRYTVADQEELANVLRGGTDRDSTSEREFATRLATADGQPLAQLLVQEYFEALVKLGVAHLVDVATDTPELLDTLIDRFRATAPEAPDAFVAIASSVSAQMMHGQHVPNPKVVDPLDPKGTSVYERTGQSVELFPAALPVPRTIVLSGEIGGPGGEFKFERKLNDAKDFKELRALTDAMDNSANAPELGIDPLKVVTHVRKQKRAFALATHATYAAASNQLLFDFPVDLMRLLASDGPDLDVGVFTAVADDDQERTKEPKPAGEGWWMLRIEVQIRKPPAQQVDKSVFELVGADDRSRRALDQYLARESDPDDEVRVYRRAKGAPGTGTTDAPPPVLTELAADRTLCVMANTARRSNPDTLLLVDDKEDDSLPVSARPTRPADFLRLVWSASIVRDGGFALRLPVTDTDLEWDESDRAALVITVRLAETSRLLPRFANAVQIARMGSAPTAAPITAPPVPTRGYSILPTEKNRNPDLEEATPRAKPGFLTLRLLRRDPDRTHAPIPALELAAGLTSTELHQQLGTKLTVGGDQIAYLREAEHDRVHLQSTYRLLALRIPAEEPAIVFRRPITPRAFDPKEEADEQSTDTTRALGLVRDDWCYRYVFNASQDGKPYARVGSEIEFSLGWRDGYGNEAPGWTTKSKVKVGYLDRLVPVGEWPRVRTRWTPGPTPNPVATVALTYQARNPADYKPEDYAEVVRAEDAHWAIIHAQLADTGEEVAVEASFLAKPKVLTSDEQNCLARWVDAVRKAPEANHSWSLALPCAPLTTESRIRLELRIRFTRKAHVDAAMPREVGTIAATIPVVMPDAAVGGIKQLARDFEAACPGLKLALGEPEVDRQERSLWAVQALLLTPVVVKTPGMFEWARFFAPAPLSLELISVQDKEVPTFAPADESGVAKKLVPVRGADPDGLLRAFFVDVETALRSDAFAKCRAAADADAALAMDRIVRAKFRIANVLEEGVWPLFDDKATEGLQEARLEFKEAIRKDLRKAYDVESIVQYDLETALPQKVGEQLFGDVFTTASDTPLQISRGRVWLCPGANGARLTTLVDATADSHPPAARAKLSLQITHVAQRIDKQCGDDPDHYLPMAWLQLVLPPLARPLAPEIADTTLQIPLPRREPPKPPTISGQVAEAWAKVPTDWAGARRWKYTVDFGYEMTPGDDVLAAVKFERYSAGPRQAANAGREDSLQGLVAALAGWQSSARVAMAAIEAARVGSDPAVIDVAIRAYQYLSHVIRAVRDALPACSRQPQPPPPP